MDRYGPDQDSPRLPPAIPRDHSHTTTFAGSFQPFATDADSARRTTSIMLSPTRKALMQTLLMLGGVPTKLLTRGQFITAFMWRPITLICTVFVAAYDCYSSILQATGTSVWNVPLMLDLTVYAASHVTKCIGLICLHRMHGTVAIVSEGCESRSHSTDDSTLQRHQIVHLLSIRESSMLVVVTLVLFSSSVLASISDYLAGHYPKVMGPRLATLLTVGYSVSHVSFACCLVLIVAAVERARKYVEEAAMDVWDWRFARPRYMRLVKRLRSHCRFVRTPIVICFASLCLSSVASGIDIWYVGQGHESTPLHIMLVGTQVVNFSCWTLLMLTLLREFGLVRKEIKRCFIDKIKEELMGVGDDSADLSLQNDLQSSLDLMINIEPAGWFLTDSWHVGESLFNFGLVLSLMNFGAKMFDVLKNLKKSA